MNHDDDLDVPSATARMLVLLDLMDKQLAEIRSYADQLAETAAEERRRLKGGGGT